MLYNRLFTQALVSRERWQGHLGTPAVMMQVHEEGSGSHLLLVKSLLPMASKHWVRPGEQQSSLRLLSSIRPHRQPAHYVFWWCIYTSASLKALTQHYCAQNAAEGPKPAKSRVRSWFKSRGSWRRCSAHWYSNIFLWETHISHS